MGWKYDESCVDKVFINLEAAILYKEALNGNERDEYSYSIEETVLIR